VKKEIMFYPFTCPRVCTHRIKMNIHCDMFQLARKTSRKSLIDLGLDDDASISR
jgi:hypothetical protein